MTDEPSAQALSFYAVKQTATENIHNDLGNAAYHYRKIVEKRETGGDIEGIKFDMMSALVMSAFFIEASINYIGNAKAEGWGETKNFRWKRNKVVATVGLTPNYTARPWSVIERLIEFRNTLAHGKPKLLTTSRIVEGPLGTAIEHQTLQSRWLDELSLDAVIECYDDANEVSMALFEAAGIEPLEAASGGSASVTFHGPAIQGTGMPPGWKAEEQDKP